MGEPHLGSHKVPMGESNWEVGGVWECGPLSFSKTFQMFK